MNEREKRLQEILDEVHQKMQSRPDQFIVCYFRKDNDELIGYHLNTFCQITSDVLEAKRYAGEDPYPQLQIIAENLKDTLDGPDFNHFKEIQDQIKESFGHLKFDQIYIMEKYMAEGMEPQEPRHVIISTKEDPPQNLN